MAPLRGVNRVSRCEPLYGDIVIRIREPGAGLARKRALTRLAVRFPRHVQQFVDGSPMARIAGIEEAGTEALFEFLARQGPVGLAFSDFRYRQASPWNERSQGELSPREHDL